jgi:hypothetical protein
MPDPEESNTVISGNGFPAVDSEEPSEPDSWGRAPNFAEQRAMNSQASAAAIFPD